MFHRIQIQNLAALTVLLAAGVVSTGVKAQQPADTHSHEESTTGADLGEQLKRLKSKVAELEAALMKQHQANDDRHQSLFGADCAQGLKNDDGTRTSLAMLTTVFMASGFAVAQEAHEHGKQGHDHDAMMKQEMKIDEALATLPAEDQKLAAAQRFCPIMTYDRLGSMGTPIKVMIEGKPVFLSCKACKDDAVKGGENTVKTVIKLRDSTQALAKLPMDERMAIEAQKYCAVANTSFLGSMGAPIKMEVDGKPVYLCCKGCTKKAQADPAASLAKAEKLKKAGTLEGHDHKQTDHKH